MALSSSGTPSPVLAEHLRMVAPSRPRSSSIWAATLSGSAAGRSILLITGMMSRLFSMAR